MCMEILYLNACCCIAAWQGIRQHISNYTTWDPPPIAAGNFATTTIAMHGAKPGDIVTATHSSLGSQHLAALITARVSAANEVTVVVMNVAGDAKLDLAEGVARAAIVQYL
jgi:hypothetical protein